MKKTILITAMLLASPSFANYVMRVPVIEKITFYPNQSTEYGQWTSVDNSESCDEWTPLANEVDFGVSYIKSRNCDTKEKRTVKIIASNNKGQSIILSDTVEEKETSDLETDNNIGNFTNISVSGQSSLEFQNNATATFSANLEGAKPTDIQWSHSPNISAAINNDKITVSANNTGSAWVKYKLNHKSGLSSKWSEEKAFSLVNNFIDTRYLSGKNFNQSFEVIPVSGVSNFTLEAWVKPHKTIKNGSVSASSGIDGTTGENYIFNPTHMGNSGNHGLGLSVGTNGVKVHVHSNGYMPALFVSYRSIPSNKWSHIAVSVSDSTPTVYLNGSAIGTGHKPSRGQAVASNNLGYNGGYGPILAEVAQARTWSGALTSDQVKDSYQKYLSPGFSHGSSVLIAVKH